MNAVTHPRLAPRRGSRAGSWWSKAVLRAVEEAAYGEAELKQGRALARAGSVGAITVDVGSAVASVESPGGTESVRVTIPALEAAERDTLVELVAAGSGRIGALLAGELPHAFVEAIEEAGVELLPYGGELGSECSCESWLDPCAHALAVMTQLAWLVRVDPFVLTHLRGLPREEVLQRLHALTVSDPRDGAAVGRDSGSRAGGVDRGDDVDLEVAVDAAERARRMLADLEGGSGGGSA